MTTKEQLNSTPRVAAFMSWGDQVGDGARCDPDHLPGDLDGRIGSVWTAYLSPRNARSDMAVSRQMTTPSITGRDCASCPHGDRFYGAVLSPSPRAVVATARYLAMLVAIDQIASARMPGRKP